MMIRYISFFLIWTLSSQDINPYKNMMTASIHYQAASKLFQENNIDSALEELNHFLKYRPDHIYILKYMAQVQLNQDRIEKSYSIFKKSSAIWIHYHCR